MRDRLLALLAVGLLAGCGSSSSDGSPSGGSTSDDSPSGDAGTSLTIVVTPDEGVDPKRYELTCDPAGGDHPQPQQACDVLAESGADVFDPVPADRACTEIYGGPQTATVRGTYDGQAVDATFSRQNGCEIDRWEQLGTTVLAVPLQ